MIAIAKTEDRTLLAFPENELKVALKKWWAKEALERADDPFAPTTKTGGNLYDLLPALDSLTIVCSFILIEEILRIKVPVGLVKHGGYCSKEEMLADLLPKLRKYYENRHT